MTQPYTADLIPDYATKRETIHWKGRSYDDNSNYDPPANGIHLCGQTDDGKQFATAQSYPMDAAKARRLFAIARDVAACSIYESDFVVDLFINNSCDEDFHTNRQLWPHAIAAWNAADGAV